jgi:hypothetical protein
MERLMKGLHSITGRGIATLSRVLKMTTTPTFMYLGACVLVVGALVLYIVPVGLPVGRYEAFFLWSTNHGVMTSPGGSSTIRVVVNDAGAMHSGNHWMWILGRTFVGREKVLGEGYIDNIEYVRARSIPVRWVSENEIEVDFCMSRKSSERLLHRIAVK